MTFSESRDRIWEVFSNDRWELALSIEWVGKDLVCKLTGGESHVGAVALAQWKGDSLQAEVIGVGSHKESQIVGSVATTICHATRRPVVVVAGIHFDGISKTEIQSICDSAMELARRAAAHFKA